MTDDAYPYGAVFSRRSARERETASHARDAAVLREALAKIASDGRQSRRAQDAAFVLTDLIARLERTPAVGRVIVEGDPTVLEVHPELDPVLAPGDRLFMPRRPREVAVSGEVLRPGSLPFASGATARDYIERAGGSTKTADDDRLFVVLPNGTTLRPRISFWNFVPEPVPPGSVIVVPMEHVRFGGEALAERIAQIEESLALSDAALLTMTR